MKLKTNIMSRRKSSRSGQALIEFTLVGVPMIFVTISVVSVSIDGWEFQNLAYATEMTARYASTHGNTCSQNNNTCTVTLGQVAQYFANQSLALNAGLVSVTLTDGSGSTTCNPVNTCNSSQAQFPAASYNTVGSDVTIQATYNLTNPIAMFWAPNKVAAHDYTVGAKSRQRILF